MNALQEIRSHEVLWLVAHDSTSNGIVGMTNCLRREPGGDKIRCQDALRGIVIITSDTHSHTSFNRRCIFNPHLDSRQQTFFQDCPLQALRTVYSDILKKDLATNVYRDNCWGTYRHIPIKSCKLH